MCHGIEKAGVSRAPSNPTRKKKAFTEVLLFALVHFSLLQVKRAENLHLGLLGNVVQVGTQQLDALNVVALVELLVDRVRAVGRAAHGKQQNVLARGLLKGQGNRNATQQQISVSKLNPHIMSCHITEQNQIFLTFHPHG